MLNAGTKIGPYEITSQLGAGGMGEVYRARDTNLGRDVAIKVLPDVFARDSDRMARFGREAKLLAALNHPNIATIHGLEDANNTRALVMELAEGPTLAERIAQGPIPIEEALAIAKQIADALEYAHERGIMHRDLKPANVKVSSNDTAKILDFGLAKALETEPSAADLANSPTISRMATQAGVLLGTAAYMSPEQAKAKPVDRRADIWAFGCVLYEMLTGKMAFRGDTVTDTLAAVIRAEPDWSRIPADTPMRVRVLLHRCLQKDAKQRLRDIGDARISLDEVLSGAPEGAPSLAAAGRPAKQWRLWLISGIAGLFILAAAFLAFLYVHQKPPATQAMRFEIPVPEKFVLGSYALSPNGRQLALIGTGADGQPRLWVRSVDTLEMRPLEGTEGAAGFLFWSPDSRYVVFLGQGKLKKIEPAGGPPLALCDATTLLGGAWNRDDRIVFGTNNGLLQVSASGGSSSSITTDGAAVTPSFLPDGRHFVYSHLSVQGGGPGTYVGSLGMPASQPPKKLLADVSVVAYAPSSDTAVAYLLFVRGTSAPGAAGTLMAQPFDTRRLELAGEAVPIAERVSNLSFSISATDVLVYVTGSQSVTAAGVRGIVQGQLAWFGRDGKILGTFGDPGSYRTVALSPDGKRVAFDRADTQNSGTRNIWLYDFGRGVTTRFTFDSAMDAYPLWSPDGSRIAFSSNREGIFHLYQKTSDLAGEDELLYKSPDHKVPTSWSPDGRTLLYFNPVPPSQLWFLPLDRGEDRKSTLVEHSEFNEAVPRFSPDGRWIAYISNESGKDQIYVRPFTPPATAGTSAANGTPVTGKWMVSKDGGTNPLWRRDGKELFYMSAGGGTAMAVDVNTTGVFQAGVPKALFNVPPGVLFWDVSPDGNRFVMAAPALTNTATQARFTMVLNWQAALKK